MAARTMATDSPLESDERTMLHRIATENCALLSTYVNGATSYNLTAQQLRSMGFDHLHSEWMAWRSMSTAGIETRFRLIEQLITLFQHSALPAMRLKKWTINCKATVATLRRYFRSDAQLETHIETYRNNVTPMYALLSLCGLPQHPIEK
jgi:hypothetical protein